jgi:hypothetical protein
MAARLRVDVRSARVHLVGMPPMAAEVVGALLSADETLTVVTDGSVEDAGPADTLLAGPDVGDPRLLLGPVAHPRVIAITADGRRGQLLELRISTTDLGELAPATLLAAVRGSIDRGTRWHAS